MSERGLYLNLLEGFLNQSFALLYRAGELTPAEQERIVNVIEHPLENKIPEFYLNHRRDIKDGKSTHATSQQVDINVRDAIERLKKIRFIF